MSLGKLQQASALTALLQLAAETALDDAFLRHAAAFGLAESQSSSALLQAAEGAGEAERLTLTVALGRQRSPLVGKMLDDESERVRLAAAHAIWDGPIGEAYPALADALDGVDPSNEPLLRRAVAASVATRSPEHLQGLIAVALRSDLTPEMRTHVWQLVREWAAPVSREPVHGLWRPLEPRPTEVLAAALRAALRAINEAGPHGVSGQVVAAELGVDEARAALVTIVAAEGQPAELRSRALIALAGADEQLVSSALDAGLNAGDPAVRSAARQVMIERFPERAVEMLAAAIETATTSERQIALMMLAGIKVDAAREVISAWFDRLEQGDCPPELQLEVLEAAVQSGDPALASRHKQFLDRLISSKPLGAFAVSLAGGNAESGARIFTEDTALACRRCHSVTPGELLVGPNLADVGLRLSRIELLEAIVKPNAKIAQGFQTTVLQLDSGEVVAGILRSENEQELKLVDRDGKELVVNAATIEGRSEGLSAMPEDLVKLLTPRTARDLVEFLSQQREPAGGAVPALETATGHGAEP
jgi:quinoprotein glucose dehydrogenase